MKAVHLKIPASCRKPQQKTITVSIASALLFLSGCTTHNVPVSSASTPFYLAYESEKLYTTNRKWLLIYNVTVKILPVIEENKSAEVARKIAENRKNAVFEIKQLK